MNGGRCPKKFRSGGTRGSLARTRVKYEVGSMTDPTSQFDRRQSGQKPELPFTLSGIEVPRSCR